jgi:nucleotide-binding universal stress UspA family protein
VYAAGVIVVGIDGSRGSESALRFAAQEAELHNVKLRVVIAWHIGRTVYMSTSALAQVDAEAMDEDARKEAEDEVERVLGPQRSENIEVVARQGDAAALLIDESQRAQILVVGSRGHGGFAGLLLGSVGQQCASHSHCPVVIVHPPAN